MARKSTVYSSFVFLTNVIVAYMYQYYLYSALFGALFVTSIVVHVNEPNIYTNMLDKLVVSAVVLYGGYVFFGEYVDLCWMAVIVIATFLATIFLYVYGFCHNKYCFAEDVDIGNAYHSLLHFIASFGHHLVVLC